MAYSEVEIVNLALNSLGKDSIRDFSVSDDDPKSGRISERLYQITRDNLISSHDWSFARATEELRKVDQDHVEGVLYALPSDCFVPRRLYPRGGKANRFHIEGGNLLIPNGFFRENGVKPYLKYTRLTVHTGLFKPYFVEALATALAAKLCMPMTRDRKLLPIVKEEARTAYLFAARIDSNIDSGDDHVDLDLEHDTFIDPDPMGVVFNG